MLAKVLLALQKLTIEDLTEIWLGKIELNLRAHPSFLQQFLIDFLKCLFAQEKNLPKDEKLIQPNTLARLYFLYVVLQTKIQDPHAFKKQMQQLMLQIFNKYCELHYHYFCDFNDQVRDKSKWSTINLDEQAERILEFEIKHFYFEKLILMNHINQHQTEYEKIFVLKAACIAYKNYLYTLIKRSYSFARYFSIQQLNEIAQQTSSAPGNKYANTNLVWLKLHAVNKLETNLLLPQDPKTKLSAFKLEFKSQQQLLARRRDTAMVKFLKIVAAVLSFGILVPWLWQKPCGAKLNDVIHHTLLSKYKTPPLDLVQTNLLDLPFSLPQQTK